MSPTSRPLPSALARVAFVALVAGAVTLRLRTACGAELVTPRVVPITSIEAEAEWGRIERLFQNGDAQEALMLLQDLLEERGNVPLRADGRFVPLRTRVTERIAALPPELLSTYEILCGPAAERLYQEGLRDRSLAGFRAAARRYLCTAAGGRALSAIASAEMDTGGYGAALIALRDLNCCPGPVPDQSVVAAKRLACLVALGRRPEADRLAAELQARGIAALTIGPNRWAVEDYVAALFQDFGAQPAAPVRAAGWPMAGGAAAGDAIGGKLRLEALDPARVALPDPPAQEMDTDQLPALCAICADGMVFVKRGGAVFAFERAARAGLRLQWRGPPDLSPERDPKSEQLPAYVPIQDLDSWLTYLNQGQSLLAWEDGRLFSVHTTAAGFEFPTHSVDAQMANVRVANEILCRDARTGSLLWRFPRAGGDDPTGKGRGLWFFTPPTVADGRSYVLALERGTAFVALCLDAANGSVLWRSDIGRIEAIQDIYQFAFEFFFYDAPPPSVSAGIAVFVTGQGAVAACDADTGDLLWFAHYPDHRIDLAGGNLPMTVPISPWGVRPPVLTEDYCILAPPDSQHLIALDLGTGEPRWSRQIETASGLLGVADRRLYVQGDTVRCLDLRDGHDLWGSGAGFVPTGRGALGEEMVYVPTRSGLQRIERRTGALLAPLALAGQEVLEGNAVVLDDALVTATPTEVVVCPLR